MNSLLIIFAKEPVPGQVKTRLCPPLSHEEAALLYRHFLLDVLEEMGRLNRLDLALAYSPAGAREFFQDLVPENVTLVPQAEADLGERLARAFDWGFDRGHAAVILRNTDSPDLPGQVVLDAAEDLTSGSADLVLGPCPDGGYYLVGLRSPQPALFQGISWSSEYVLEQTQARARRLALTVRLLPAWPDIDTAAGLQAFLRKTLPAGAPGRRSHAFAARRLQHLLPSFAT